MKQTAVEFLYEALWEAGKDKFIWQIILQQAKEMEKEQMMKVNKKRILLDYEFEQYYNETYGGK
jgi:hypothetical protein